MRYFETETSVFIKRLCLHKSFINRFKLKTVIQARKMLKQNYTHSEQDEIIHYLKEKNILNFTGIKNKRKEP